MISKKLILKKISHTISLLIILYSSHAVSGGGATTSLTVSATIIDSACHIESNSGIVEFGVIQIDELASAKVKIPVTIACDSAPSGTVSVELKGSQSIFDANSLATDVPGLGIVFNKESTSSDSLKLNEFYDVSSAFGLKSKVGTFYLSASLVSDGTTKINGGEFNASATLVLQVV